MDFTFFLTTKIFNLENENLPEKQMQM